MADTTQAVQYIEPTIAQIKEGIIPEGVVRVDLANRDFAAALSEPDLTLATANEVLEEFDLAQDQQLPVFLMASYWQNLQRETVLRECEYCILQSRYAYFYCRGHVRAAIFVSFCETSCDCIADEEGAVPFGHAVVQLVETQDDIPGSGKRLSHFASQDLDAPLVFDATTKSKGAYEKWKLAKTGLGCWGEGRFIMSELEKTT